MGCNQNLSAYGRAFTRCAAYGSALGCRFKEHEGNARTARVTFSYTPPLLLQYICNISIVTYLLFFHGFNCLAHDFHEIRLDAGSPDERAIDIWMLYKLGDVG